MNTTRATCGVTILCLIQLALQTVLTPDDDVFFAISSCFAVLGLGVVRRWHNLLVPIYLSLVTVYALGVTIATVAVFNKQMSTYQAIFVAIWTVIQWFSLLITQAEAAEATSHDD